MPLFLLGSSILSFSLVWEKKTDLTSKEEGPEREMYWSEDWNGIKLKECYRFNKNEMKRRFKKVVSCSLSLSFCSLFLSIRNILILVQFYVFSLALYNHSIKRMETRLVPYSFHFKCEWFEGREKLFFKMFSLFSLSSDPPTLCGLGRAHSSLWLQ